LGVTVPELRAIERVVRVTAVGSKHGVLGEDREPDELRDVADGEHVRKRTGQGPEEKWDDQTRADGVVEALEAYVVPGNPRLLRASGSILPPLRQ
jgi:hypothetical protein